MSWDEKKPCNSFASFSIQLCLDISSEGWKFFPFCQPEVGKRWPAKCHVPPANGRVMFYFVVNATLSNKSLSPGLGIGMNFGKVHFDTRRDADELLDKS